MDDYYGNEFTKRAANQANRLYALVERFRKAATGLTQNAKIPGTQDSIQETWCKLCSKWVCAIWPHNADCPMAEGP
jgi:hypothetical protein